jgi:hypothetical protein
MAIEAIIAGAVTVQNTLPGIVQSYTDTPASLTNLPCFVTYPSKGELLWPRKGMVRTVTSDMHMDLYIQKGGDIAAADRLLKPYIDQVINLFDQNITLGGNCVTSGVVSYEYGVINVAGVDYLGIKFILRAIEMAQVIYHA